jgi:hypothetical protein
MMDELTTTSTIASAPDGCAISSQLDLWQTATSMNATSATSNRRTSRVTRNATSLPALAFGRSHSDGPDGLTRAAFGPDPVHVSLSARQAEALGLVTTDISGLRGSGSSASARLSRLLASKYQARTARLGSTLYRLTWKHCGTPAGRWLSVQQASGRRTSDSGFIGWPTPTATDAERRGATTARSDALHLNAASQLAAGWATPHESDHRPGHASRMHDTSRINLNDQAMLAGWPTPTSFDSVESWGGRRKNGERNGGGNCPSLRHLAADLAGWATPIQADARGSPDRKKHSELSQQATLAGWSTPASRDYRTPNHQTYADRGGGAKGEQLNNQVAHVIPGASLNGSRAATESCGLLNPAFSAWLQGIPREWALHAPAPSRSRRGSQATLPCSEHMATRSTRTSRRKSSLLGLNATDRSNEHA